MAKVQVALEELSGVESAVVDLAKAEAVISMKKEVKAPSSEEMIAAIVKIGFTATL